MSSIQDCKRKLKECEVIIEQAREAKKLKKSLEEKLKSLKIDLVRDKKIQRLSMTFEDWLEKTDYEYFYVFRNYGDPEYVVWKGEDMLSSNERSHFNEYLIHYLVRGYPDYHEYDEMSPLEHGIEDGDLHYVVHCRKDYFK